MCLNLASEVITISWPQTSTATSRTKYPLSRSQGRTRPSWWSLSRGWTQQENGQLPGRK